MPTAWRHAAVTASVAAALFLVAVNGGAYDLISRHVLSIAVWWVVVLAVAFGFWPHGRTPRAVIVGAALFLALALFTGLSATWAPSAERALLELHRVLLYVGVFLVGALGATRRRASAWTDGLALGLVLVTVLALTSRFVEGVASDQGELPDYLPSAAARLSFPLGYWNGLGIFVALGVPLLLRAATSASRPLVRGAAVTPLPAIAAVVYLASSRGAAATALVGAVLFLALSRRRWAALWALAIAVAASVAYLRVLTGFQELVNGPLGSAAAREQAVNAAFLLVAAGGLAGLVYGLVAAVRAPRPPAVAGWVTAVLVVALASVAVAAAEPRRRFADFRRRPEEVPVEGDDYVRAHLMSAGGSGRWQFWEASIEQFRSARLRGQGAGTYEAWWAQHGTLNTFIVDAHSLYVETLGELGLIGFFLLAAAILFPLAVGARRLLAMPPREGEVAAAALAAGCAFLVAAGVDWIWELTAVGALGVVLLGLLCGAATLPPPPGEKAPAQIEPRFGLGVAVLVAGWFAIIAAAAPLLRDVSVRASQAAAARGELEQAAERALAAQAVEPWSAAPRLQLALVHERAGDLESARRFVAEAIERDPQNWRLWLIAARIHTRAGAVADARSSFVRARELNPRSPVFRE